MQDSVQSGRSVKVQKDTRDPDGQVQNNGRHTRVFCTIFGDTYKVVAMEVKFVSVTRKWKCGH